MTKKEVRFTNIIRSRGIGCILAFVSAWSTWRCLPLLDVPEGWLSVFPELSFVGNYALLFLTAIIMIAINRSYSLLRTLSVFFAAYFIFVTSATPQIAAYGCVSSLLALAAVACMWLLFSVYNTRACDRRVFLIFFILGTGALFDRKFLFLAPVYFVGLGQMRILRFKKIVAAFIGLITAPWIVFGLDLMPLPEMPEVFFTPPSLLLNTPGGWPFLCTVLITMAIGFIFGSLALLRILGFNARLRAYNGFLALLGIYTGVLAIVNFTALADYVALLNACVAFQVGHFFRATSSRRGYIMILLLLALYAALYVWSVL